MKKLTWKEVFMGNIVFCSFMFVFLGALFGWVVYSLVGVLGCILAVIYAGLLVVLIGPISDKFLMGKCSCGKVINTVRFLNWKMMCPNCDKKVKIV